MFKIAKLLAVLLVGAGLGYFVGHRHELAQSGVVSVLQETADRQAKAISELKTNLTLKETELTTQKAAFEQLQESLKGQENSAQELKRQLAFFERIIRPEQEQVGVVIDSISLQTTSVADRFHYSLTLTQPTKKRELFAGQIQVRVEGSFNGQAKTLQGKELGMKSEQSRYSLRYFQLLEGNWTLPNGFIAEWVIVTINKKGRQPAQELKVSWEQALKAPATVATSTTLPQG